MPWECPIPNQHTLSIPNQHTLPIPNQHALPIPNQHALPQPRCPAPTKMPSQALTSMSSPTIMPSPSCPAKHPNHTADQIPPLRMIRSFVYLQLVINSQESAAISHEHPVNQGGTPSRTSHYFVHKRVTLIPNMTYM
jgi:hypothetical protein